MANQMPQAFLVSCLTPCVLKREPIAVPWIHLAFHLHTLRERKYQSYHVKNIYLHGYINLQDISLVFLVASQERR